MIISNCDNFPGSCMSLGSSSLSLSTSSDVILLVSKSSSSILRTILDVSSLSVRLWLRWTLVEVCLYIDLLTQHPPPPPPPHPWSYIRAEIVRWPERGLAPALSGCSLPPSLPPSLPHLTRHCLQDKLPGRVAKQVRHLMTSSSALAQIRRQWVALSKCVF